jgi:hypothetical protein
MEGSIVAIPERAAVSLSRFGRDRRVTEQILGFDVRRPLSRDVALCSLVSVVETLLAGAAIIPWRWSRRRRRRVISGLGMSASR